MLRKKLKKLIPTRARIKQIKLHERLGTWIYRPSLWHINRHSVSMAIFVGLSIAFVPAPGQTLLAAFFALQLRCNLPLALTVIWVSNPVTMPVLYYFSYRVGALLLQVPDTSFDFELNWQWLSGTSASIWKPLLLGCFTCGVTAGALGYFSMNMIWRTHVARRWRSRSQKKTK